MMHQRRLALASGSGLVILVVCFVSFLSGCVSLVSKPYKIYDGPALSRDKIAVLVCVLNVQVSVDDKENINPESHKWGSRIEMLPGTHRVGVRPYASFLGPGYTNLPDLLDEDVVYFEAVAGKTYNVMIEKTHVDKTLLAKDEKVAIYLVNDIAIIFYIVESGSNKVVSRRTD